MRISAKGRYAVAAMLDLARNSSGGDTVTVVSISGRLGISKIYLEQVFSLLKRSGLVTSIKGAQGGYQLQRSPWQITALEILKAVEVPLFEETEDTVPETAPDVEEAMKGLLFAPLDQAIRDTLGKVTLQDLLTQAQEVLQGQGPMFYI